MAILQQATSCMTRPAHASVYKYPLLQMVARASVPSLKLLGHAHISCQLEVKQEQCRLGHLTVAARAALPSRRENPQTGACLKERMWLSSEMTSWRVTRPSSMPACCSTYRQLATTCTRHAAPRHVGQEVAQPLISSRTERVSGMAGAGSRLHDVAGGASSSFLLQKRPCRQGAVRTGRRAPGDRCRWTAVCRPAPAGRACARLHSIGRPGMQCGNRWARRRTPSQAEAHCVKSAPGWQADACRSCQKHWRHAACGAARRGAQQTQHAAIGPEHVQHDPAHPPGPGGST